MPLKVKFLLPGARTPSSPRTRSSGSIDDWQLLELERTLTKELGEGDLEVTPENLKKVFAHTADSFLGLVRQVLDMAYLPNYKDVVARQFESYVTQHNYNADQIRFLRAVKSVFLQKRHLETADLYEPPLDPWRGCGGAVVYGEGSKRSG